MIMGGKETRNFNMIPDYKAAFKLRAIKCLLVAIYDCALHPAISCSDWAFVKACPLLRFVTSAYTAWEKIVQSERSQR